MTTFADRTARIRTFTALVDAAIRAEDHEEKYVAIRKAAAFEHILEAVARVSPSALDLIEECFVPFYQTRLDEANKETENG